MADILEGEIVLRRAEHGVEVVRAPRTAYVSLAAVQGAAADEFVVDGNQLVVAGGQVRYRVVGWDVVQSALVAERCG